MARMGLVELLNQLLTGSEPVSFYDALTIVRQARGTEPSEPLLRAMLDLHDAEHTTDGARTVLADYFRALARRQENQRRLASRPLTLKDHGKTARASVGSTLQLRLEERRSAGFRWQVETQSGGGKASRSPASHDFASTAVFDVKLHKTGELFLELFETPPPTGAPDQRLQPRTFHLRVVIEAPLETSPPPAEAP